MGKDYGSVNDVVAGKRKLCSALNDKKKCSSNCEIIWNFFVLFSMFWEFKNVLQ